MPPSKNPRRPNRPQRPTTGGGSKKPRSTSQRKSRGKKPTGFNPVVLIGGGIGGVVLIAVILFFVFGGGGNNGIQEVGPGADPTAVQGRLHATLPQKEDPQGPPMKFSDDPSPRVVHVEGNQYRAIVPYVFDNSDPEPETWYIFQASVGNEFFLSKYQGKELQKQGEVSWEFTTQAPPPNPDYKPATFEVRGYYAATPEGPFGKTRLAMNGSLKAKPVEVANKPTETRPIYFLDQSKVRRLGERRSEETFLAVVFDGNESVSQEFAGKVEASSPESSSPPGTSNSNPNNTTTTNQA
ncbi:MAG: hypothetical protein KDA84_24865, partial [Planctomycetaceae bacterium]|nr:hypothetical protein [Planctomycetaceae bacterium]